MKLLKITLTVVGLVLAVPSALLTWLMFGHYLSAPDVIEGRAFRIKAELSVAGETDKVVIDRVIGCQGNRFYRGKSWSVEYTAIPRGVGATLSNGSGLVIATPTACSLFDDDGSFQAPNEKYLPLVGLIDYSGDTQELELFLTGESISLPDSLVKLHSFSIEQVPNFTEATPDQFSWFGYDFSVYEEDPEPRVFEGYLAFEIFEPEWGRVAELAEYIQVVTVPTVLPVSLLPQIYEAVRLGDESQRNGDWVNAFRNTGWIRWSAEGEGLIGAPTVYGRDITTLWQKTDISRFLSLREKVFDHIKPPAIRPRGPVILDFQGRNTGVLRLWKIERSLRDRSQNYRVIIDGYEHRIAYHPTPAIYVPNENSIFLIQRVELVMPGPAS